MRQLTAHEAVAALQSGQIIALDTPTIPGLSGNLDTFDQLCALKQRPTDCKMCILIGEIPPTLSEREKDFLRMKHTTVILSDNKAYRFVPALRHILQKTGPLFSTSINIHGDAACFDASRNPFGLDYYTFIGPKTLQPSRLVRLHPFATLR